MSLCCDATLVSNERQVSTPETTTCSDRSNSVLSFPVLDVGRTAKSSIAMPTKGKRYPEDGLRPTVRPSVGGAFASSSLGSSPTCFNSGCNENESLSNWDTAEMPAKFLQPLNYTTPPFAAVSGVVEYDGTPMTTSTPTEPAEHSHSKSVLEGPWWAMAAVILLVAAMIVMSIAWWRTLRARLASGYYNQLGPVSNYREWRERQASKLLRSTTTSSATPSRRASGSQQSGIAMNRGPSSSSPDSSKD
ncbi:hypothetical protein M409DRAFT_52077 [Zasmidium cellare ATCC 36951]|uniref:Uncharacterized protein n=1 Tax=Zasmidium cellare ATCC 36951 TaxID=1080233 RepID=A0A6A6CR35_ZASCE|nr:uncharacterized protein M409DRAFT_52077 [Zasmidium cellare ATCC 36951]KAF2169541.1 hypothetical protein M409DRAFT_52077 [Zasmidium cellare ATCC 36951]